MERVVNFGKLSFDQQLKMLQEEMNTKDILLFQYYERDLDIIESQDQIDESRLLALAELFLVHLLAQR